MPKHIVALLCSLVVPDTEPNSSSLPIEYQSARRVGRKERNAADTIKVVSVFAVKPELCSEIRCHFLNANVAVCLFSLSCCKILV